MTNEEQNELLDILMENNINAVISPGKDGPTLRVFYSYKLKDWDHKSLSNYVISNTRINNG